MPVDYTYDPVKKIIHTRAHGVVTVSEITSYLEAILADDKIVYNSVEVFSLEDATDLIMQYSEVYIFQKIWARYKERIGQKIFVIAPDKLSFGLFRMLASVVALEYGEAENAFRIFSTRDELKKALEEIGKERKSRPDRPDR